jgi:hypothetical protein
MQARRWLGEAFQRHAVPVLPGSYGISDQEIVMDEILSGIISNPAESVAVELKRWLDLADRRHVAKIIKACAALHNSNGGYLIIGVNNDGTFQTSGVPPDWRSIFDPEILQQLVANRVSPPFEIEVIHVQTANVTCVAIKISSGAISPICIRSDLNDRDGTALLAQHEVYCRSLSSNGKYSSARPSADDWARIIRTFLDNREADIARFLSRNFTSDRMSELTRQLVQLYPGQIVTTDDRGTHEPESPSLVGPETIDDDADLEVDTLLQIIAADPENNRLNDVLSAGLVALSPGSSIARACMADGHNQFEAAIHQSGTPPSSHGSWELAAVLNGSAENALASVSFLNRIASANPVYTYVPFWTAGRGATSNLGRPYVLDNGWQSLINAPPHALNFWRAEPRGHFYVYRALEDDMSMSPQQPEPMTKLDFTLQVIRLTDAIAVILAISAVIPMRIRPQSVELIIRWRRLAGRELSSWANITRVLPPGRMAFQDEFATSIVVPTNATPSGISGYVHEVTRQLFSLFDGMQFDPSTIDDIARGVFERRM